MVIASTLCACHNHTTSITDCVTINVSEGKESSSIDCIIDTANIEFITLETNTDCILGDINKISFKGDTIIIFDIQTKSIYFFDNNGNYLSKIHRVGRSKSEYIDIYDACFSDDEIIILDNDQFKVLAYDYAGKYKYSFEIPDGVSINSKDEKIFIGNMWGGAVNCGYQVLVYNKAGEQLSTHLKVGKKDQNRFYEETSFFTKSGDILYYWQPTDDVVYKYENGDFVPSYMFDFGKNSLPLQIARKGLSYVIKNNLHKKYSWVKNLSESGRYRFITYEAGSELYPMFTSVYDKKKKKMIASSLLLNVDKVGYGQVIPQLDDSGEYMILYIPGGFASEIQKSNKGKYGETSIWPQSDLNLTDNDNGVLIKMKLKGYDAD